MKNTFRKMLVKGTALSLFSMAAILATSINADAARCTRDQGQQYCTGDAMRLCSAFIPNEAKIQACLKKNVRKLSPDCKKCFSSHSIASWHE